MRTRGVEDTGRTRTEISNKQSSWAIIETEVTIAEPVGVYANSPLMSYGAFVEFLTVAVEVSLTLLSVLGTLFLLLGCLI